jgi:hypothetical protein
LLRYVGRKFVREALRRSFRFPAAQDKVRGEGKMSKDGQIKKEATEITLKKNPSRSRPMKVVMNGEGNPWICACEADPSKDLAAQDCWQLRENGSTGSKEKSPGKKRRRTS